MVHFGGGKMMIYFKKTISLLLVSILLCLSGCQMAVERDKNEMLRLYGNDDNFIKVSGEIVSISYESVYSTALIKGIDLSEKLPIEEDTCLFWIFSQEKMDLLAGDVIIFTTATVRFKSNDWLPIVEIIKDGNTVLSIDCGKESLLSWVNQLQYK